MLLKFKSLILHNFLSFSDAEVILDDQGYVLVSGINNCKADLAKSNGSGKSSIWEGIVWALTGETIRGTKDVINKYGTDGTFVEINFNVDSDTYKIIRYKEYSNTGTNLKLYINNVDKSGKGIRDTEKLLEQYLPDITGSLIGSVIILGQGLPQRFTNNTPSGRKEVLEKLSKSDFMIEDIKSKISAREAELEKELRKYKDLILSASSQQQLIQNNLDSVKSQIESIVVVDFDRKLAEAEDKYKSLQSCIDLRSYEDAKLKLDDCRNNYKIFDLSCKNELNEAENEFADELDKAKTNLLELDLKIKSLNSEISRLDSIKDVCPTCGQKLPDVHKVDTTSLKNDLISANNERQKASDLVKSINDRKQAKLDNIKTEQDKRKEKLIQDGKELKEAFDLAEQTYNKQLSEVEEAKSVLDKLKTDQELYKFKWNQLNESQHSLEEQFKKLEEEILYNNNVKDNIEARLEIVSKMMTIAKRDFRGFLLSGVIDFINQRSKEYSKEVFDTGEVDFKLDGNNIYIGYNGKQYENLSGGEKQKVDLIVQFSIRDMLSQYLNFSSNILVVDEICDNLDSIGCQKVLNMLATKLTDVSSLFIISHHTDIDIPVDRELVVIKDENGLSTIGV